MDSVIYSNNIAPVKAKKAGGKRTALKVVFIVVAALIIVICVFPLIWLILSGFKPASDFLSGKFTFFPTKWTVANYWELLSNNTSSRLLPKYASLPRSIVATFMVASFSLVLSLFVNSAAAYVFARLNFRGKKLAWGYYALTMFMPAMAVQIPCYQVCNALGLLNSFWVLCLPGVPYVWSIFFYRQYYLSVPRSLEEAAKVDGCSKIGIYFKLFLPMSATPFVIMGISVFQGFWNSYVWPVLTVNNPHLMQVNQLIIYFKSSRGTQWNYLMAASAVSSIPLLLILLIFQKYIMQGVKISGIK